jgi:hypothetical protein
MLVANLLVANRFVEKLQIQWVVFMVLLDSSKFSGELLMSQIHQQIIFTFDHQNLNFCKTTIEE